MCVQMPTKWNQCNMKKLGYAEEKKQTPNLYSCINFTMSGSSWTMFLPEPPQNVIVRRMQSSTCYCMFYFAGCLQESKWSS